MVFAGTAENRVAVIVDFDAVIAIAAINAVVCTAANSDFIGTSTSINRIAGAIDCDVVSTGSRGNLVSVAANCNDVCTITGINGIAAAIDCDVVITAASGDMIVAAERDFIVAGDKTSNGNVTSGAEVEFARRCSVDRAAGAFYLHNTAAGGIHCNRIVGREVEFAA